MAHRSLPRDAAFGSLMEPEGMSAAEKHRATRRNRSATPGMASHWEENRRLYMDNLRLWDCLTLVRSDPAMTCQNAIKLVFGLDDDDYFRMFPDTRQLMLLMFPGGVVFHSSSEEAKIENARLKDENARLHAAVWVLRDNPSFQADSTVAAIFRLDEAQFQSKFHSVNVATLEPALATTPSKTPYQNNNKEKKKIRSSLGMGREPSMAIQLTNCPIKIGGFACDKPSSKTSRQPRSQSMMPPWRHSQHNNGCFNCHQDFTSNWKPTTPMERQPAGGKIRTSKQSHLKTNWAILCWRQNCYLRPVDLYALDGAKSPGSVRHVKSAQNPSQNQNSSRHGKARHLRRSNTVSREDDVVAERISRGPSHDSPVKCVSFAEPLPSYQTGSSIATKLICLKDKVSMLLDTSSEFVCPSATQEEMTDQCLVTTGQGEICDLKQNADVEVAKNANTNKRDRKSYKKSKVYTMAAAREPSKRCQKDTATSPVLDTRTCVLILAKSGRSKMPNHPAIPLSSASDDCILNKSNNNDSGKVARSRFPETIGGLKSSQRPYTRPLSPKHRNLPQTRLKNIISCKKFNVGPQIRQERHSKVTCSTNNAVNHVKYKSTLSRIPETNAISMPSSLNREQSRGNGEEDCEDEYEKECVLSDGVRTQSVHSSHTSVSNSGPQILFSEKPGTPRRSKHCPYSHASFTTVKQFLERHSNLSHDLRQRSSLASQETLTDETTSTLKPISDKPSSLKEEFAVESGENLDRLPSSSSRKDSDIASTSQYQLLAQKHKGKWNKSETHLVLPPSLKMSTSPTAGKLKLCADSASIPGERLNQLRKLGNYKYSKPLATMLKRNGCLQWTPPSESTGPAKLVVFNNFRHSSSDWAKLESMYFGPFITFIPK